MTKTKSRKTPCEELVEQQIRQCGPMPFNRFVDLALYHPTHGYYNRGSGQRGRAGDYFTSLQVSDIFPKIITDGLLAMRTELGTEQFHVLEFGSGNGELLEGILQELDRRNQLKGFQFWAFEKSRPARDQLWKRLSRFPKCHVLPSLEEMEWIGGVDGCILSNEFFDALSFHRLIRRNNAWKEIHVDLNEEKLTTKELELSNSKLQENLGSSILEFSEGQEIEVRSGQESLWQDFSRVLTRGYVLTFDYGYPRPHLYAPHRTKGTWQCFYRHSVSSEAFQNIGQQDITAHVDFTSLVELGERVGIEPALFCSQGVFLTHLGQSLIEKHLQEAPEALKAKRIGALQQLLHPDSMGERFWVLVQKKEVNLPEKLSSIPNRVRRLKMNENKS